MSLSEVNFCYPGKIHSRYLLKLGNGAANTEQPYHTETFWIGNNVLFEDAEYNLSFDYLQLTLKINLKANYIPCIRLTYPSSVNLSGFQESGNLSTDQYVIKKDTTNNTVLVMMMVQNYDQERSIPTNYVWTEFLKTMTIHNNASLFIIENTSFLSFAIYMHSYLLDFGGSYVNAT